MSRSCHAIQLELLELGWSKEQRDSVREVMDHLARCDTCSRAFDDYAALRVALRPAVSPSEQPEPVHGWEAFEQRMTHAASRKPGRRWWPAVAAGLLIALTAFIGWRLVQPRPQADNGKLAEKRTAPAISTDMTSASVAQAFRTVSEAFEGRANWVVLSDHASDLGLVNEKARTSEVLVMRVVVTRGSKPVSQIYVAVVPGATVRVTVPGAGGVQLQYVIATDGVNQQNVAVSLAVEGGEKSRGPKEIGLGSMATTLHMPYGKHTPTGQITTREGTFDLSMTLERAGGA